MVIGRYWRVRSFFVGVGGFWSSVCGEVFYFFFVRFRVGVVCWVFVFRVGGEEMILVIFVFVFSFFELICFLGSF